MWELMLVTREACGRKDAAFLAGGGDGLEAFRVFHYLPTADRQGIQESMTNLLGHEDCLAWSVLA